MAHVAASLGRFAAGTCVRDVADFAREVQLVNGMEQFVHMVCHIRRATIRRRRMLHDMLSVDLGQAAAPRWFWPLMEQGFALYCLVRQRAAAPSASHSGFVRVPGPAATPHPAGRALWYRALGS